MRIAEWRVFAEPEIGHLATGISAEGGSWDIDPLSVAFGYPLNSWTYGFPYLSYSSSAVIFLPSYYIVTSVFIATSWNGSYIGASFDIHLM